MRMRSVWSIGSVPDLGAGRLQGARAQLSRDLVALWADEYGPALELLRHALPPGLMRYLNQPRPCVPLPQSTPDGPSAGAERALSPPSRVLPSAIALYVFMYAAVYGLDRDALRVLLRFGVHDARAPVRRPWPATRSPCAFHVNHPDEQLMPSRGDSGAGPRPCALALPKKFELHNIHAKS